MRRVTLDDFAALCGGSVHGTARKSYIKGFATDSRDVKEGDLFLCIRGERSDGHEFAGRALQSGAVACLAEREIKGACIVVQNLVEALAAYASKVRGGFTGPVVGVTGSAGKTTTKEFCAAALSPLGHVLKNPGNRNTEYTSPLVWADLNPDHRTAVIEMGMRGAGQIAHLCSFTRPTVGVVTQVGTAHIEKVGSREGIAAAKSELLRSLPLDGTSILWQEDEYLQELKGAAPKSVRTFGFSPDAECRILGYRSSAWDKCVVRARLDGKTLETELHTVGRHQALNAAAAILVASTLGVDVEDAANRLSSAEIPPLRLQVIPYGSATVVLDTYNASPDSTVAALRTLSEIPAEARRLAVLGEMKELGDFTESGHRLVGRALADTQVDRVLLTGGPTVFIGEEARKAGYPDSRIVDCETFQMDRVRAFLAELEVGDVVLVKGSRALGLEQALEVGGALILGNVDYGFLAALLAIAAATVTAPLVLWGLVRIQSRQKVSEFVPEHAEKQGTPTMGGLILLAGLAAAMFFVPGGQRATPAILLGGFALIGFLDDFIVPRVFSHTRGLGWKQKFVLQILVAAGAYMAGGVRDWLALSFLVFCVLFFANAFNFADGMDTLAGGIAVMVALGFAIVGRMSMTSQPEEQALIVMMAGLAAACVPFLFLNAPPARVFMGDVGALPVGALLGWAFVMVGRPTDIVPWDLNLWAAITISAVLILELVPVPLQVLSVKLRKGKRLFLRTPIHHAFQHAGWPETRVVWLFHLVQATLIAASLGVMWRFGG